MSLPVFIKYLDSLYLWELLQVDEQELRNAVIRQLTFTLTRQVNSRKPASEFKFSVAGIAIVDGHIAIGVTLGCAGSLEILVDGCLA